jgi:hypothetical protein
MAHRQLLASWADGSGALYPARVDAELVGDEVHLTMRDPPKEDGRCGYTHGQVLSGKDFATFLADLQAAWEKLP